MRRSALRLLLVAMVLGVGLAMTPGTGLCTLIPITNPGFETDVLSDATWTNFYITGYTTSSGAAWNPPVSEYSSVPEGVNVACANGFGYISQQLAATLQDNTLYTLSVDVGKRAYPFYTWKGYQVELYAGNTRIALDNNSLNPSLGTFELSQIQYQSLSADPLQGQALKFVLRGLGGVQVNFDAVSLDATTVPLPGAVWLLGSGLLGLAGLGLRKKSIKD